jgi:hypothetical protein
VTAPQDGPDGDSAYQFHPDNLRLPVAELEKSYDPDVWSGFKKWASDQEIAAGVNVLEWLEGKALSETQSLQFENTSDAVDYAEKNLHPNDLDLSGEERLAAGEYQESSLEINRALQRGLELEPHEQNKVDLLDAAIAKSKLPRSTIVYHGGGGSFWRSLEVGSEVDLKSYLSTTLAPDNRQFAETAWIKIRMKAGSKGLYMDDLSGSGTFVNEAEILIPRNTRIKVLSMNEVDGIVNIEAEVV